MKVCFVTFAAGKEAWGAERWLVSTIQGLQARGVECCAIVNSMDAGLTNELQRLNIPVALVRFRLCVAAPDRPQWHRWARTVINLAMSFKVSWIARRWNADLIYSNSICINAGALAALWARKPHVWQVHEFGEADQGWRFDLGVRFSERMLSRLSVFCVMVSRAVATKFARVVKPGQGIVVYQTVNVEPGNDVPTPPDGRFRVVICGRLVRTKRQEDAIGAVAQLVKQGLDIELEIVGDGVGNYPQTLRRMVENLGIGNRVHFQGYQANPFPAMQAADAVLVCSIAEAFGRVTVEAFLAGKPVIGAQSGGTAELIEQADGLLYTPGNVDELANRIKALYQDRVLARQVGERSRQWAQGRFTSEHVTGEMIRILERAIGRDVPGTENARGLKPYDQEAAAV
jgi:glycosyltransferase involved in cell wall biosynthesis